MPKALILADLHLDRWQEAGIDPLADADLSDLDLLIIAGDLSNKGHLRWKDALKVIGRKIDLDRVHVGPGNHDYYGGRIDREDKLRAAAEAAGAHFLQKSELRLDGMRFLYCTLWTDMRLGGSVEDLNRFQAERIMNDYAAIRVEQEGYRKLRAHHTCEIHRDHVAWLSARLAEPFDGQTVVVTHHAPHSYSLAEPPSLQNLGFAYASDLSDLILDFNPHLWVHGHTHERADYLIGDTRVLNASLGYPRSLDLQRPNGDILQGLIVWDGADPAPRCA